MPASKPRALVVDDDPALRMLCRVNLELDGFEVLEAATIDEAEAAVRGGGIDVALLDVHLAGCNTHSLRVRLQAVGIPVAIVTGSADVDLYRAEADGVLTKPFEPQTLVELARRLARVEV